MFDTSHARTDGAIEVAHRCITLVIDKSNLGLFNCKFGSKENCCFVIVAKAGLALPF